ncbi:hypothetical protein C7S18_09505 [Ahniella affigens]|uniref:Uncharacterized protein n=1 Tax=Ahniella affigens TaxID=2021234 RepID=A0A2P1PRF5_9GAMM|nr:hypothetical protein [Ahniella affigens]AVP97415.1 hypothetical protein C7S18_09505 [Ahniella affigens]
MDLDQLHTFLERKSPAGLGYGLRIADLEVAVRAMLTRLGLSPLDGVNRNLALPFGSLAASFDVDPAAFSMEPKTGAISLDLNIWIHDRADANNPIYKLQYLLRDEPVSAGVDLAGMKVFLEPQNARAVVHAHDFSHGADPILIRLGFVDALGMADRSRFATEVAFPFIWLNAQGLMRAIVRSFPLPDVFSWFKTILPAGAIIAEIQSGYLAAWSEQVAISIPSCGLPPAARPAPKVVADAILGNPKPWSPADSSEPMLAIYLSEQPLLDWHAQALMPAIAFHQEDDGFPGWSVDGHVGVEHATITFAPSATGGSLTVAAALRLHAFASSWINGPCGLRLDVASAAISGPGSLRADFSVNYSDSLRALRSALSVEIDVPPGDLNITAGGMLPGAFAELVEWLLRAGVIHVDIGLRARSEQTLLDLVESASRLGRAFVTGRVAEHSVAFAIAWDN